MQHEAFVAQVPQLFEELVYLDLLLDEDQDAALVVPLLDDHDQFHQFLIIMLNYLYTLLDC